MARLPFSQVHFENKVLQDMFMLCAFRSDGKEVTVDNKFLKANNPLLVIIIHPFSSFGI